MKKEVNVWDYAGHIMQNIHKGCLLTTKADGQVDTMVIGWGHIGVEWGRPIFAVYVRKSRHTKTLLDKNGEFTVNVALSDPDKNIISVCGTKSGRDLDKIAHLGLTLEESDTVSVPGIREMPLTLECKVIYKQDQDKNAIDPECDARFYAKGTPNEDDYHTVYYGQITKAYILE